MKYLELESFEALNHNLRQLDLPDRFIMSKVEPYSAKMINADKKLTTELRRQFGDEQSGVETKLLAWLTMAMQLSWEDHVFSHAVRPEDFKKVPLQEAKADIDRRFTSMVAQLSLNFPGELWSAINAFVNSEGDDSHVKNDLEVYHYEPEDDAEDVFQRGALFALNYFFVSRSRKRVVYLSCICKSKLHSPAILGVRGDDAVDDDFDLGPSYDEVGIVDDEFEDRQREILERQLMRDDDDDDFA
ncbi:MAG: hypothetical protein MHM6MM_001154 [Cercozoa sp. M6MM]